MSIPQTTRPNDKTKRMNSTASIVLFRSCLRLCLLVSTGRFVFTFTVGMVFYCRQRIICACIEMRFFSGQNTQMSQKKRLQVRFMLFIAHLLRFQFIQWTLNAFDFQEADLGYKFSWCEGWIVFPNKKPRTTAGLYQYFWSIAHLTHRQLHFIPKHHNPIKYVHQHRVRFIHVTRQYLLA